MQWNTFNANKPNKQIQKQLEDISKQFLIESEIDANDTSAIIEYAIDCIDKYELGKYNLDITIAIDVFRPHELAHIRKYDKSLSILCEFIKKTTFDWKSGSHAVQQHLNYFPSAGSRRISGGREYVELDNLVIISDKRVAIEIETSNNLDNGFWTLRQAIKEGHADYGVMIVPWTANAQGRADEGKALGRLDREFDSSMPIDNGAVYRVAVVRKLDIYRMMARMIISND